MVALLLFCELNVEVNCLEKIWQSFVSFPLEGSEAGKQASLHQ